MTEVALSKSSDIGTFKADHKNRIMYYNDVSLQNVLNVSSDSFRIFKSMSRANNCRIRVFGQSENAKIMWVLLVSNESYFYNGILEKKQIEMELRKAKAESNLLNVNKFSLMKKEAIRKTQSFWQTHLGVHHLPINNRIIELFVKDRPEINEEFFERIDELKFEHAASTFIILLINILEDYSELDLSNIKPKNIVPYLLNAFNDYLHLVSEFLNDDDLRERGEKIIRKLKIIVT